jgi:hypothetical protein
VTGIAVRFGALLLGFAPVAPLVAQGAPPAPHPWILEWGVHGTLLIADSSRIGLVGGPRFAVRTLGGTRGSVALGAGVLGDSLSGRIEGAIEYQLAPRARGKPGFYVGGGLVGQVGAQRGGYLLLFVGLEQSPGDRGGWALEAGLGGGIRLRGAWHWRRFPRGWAPR